MSRDRVIDDSELTEVTGGTTLSDLLDNDYPGDKNPPWIPEPPPPGSGGTIAPEEDNPGGGIGEMEQSP